MSLIKSISGIRGTIGGKKGDGLTPYDIVEVTTGYAQWIKNQGHNHKIVIGRDARISGQLVENIVISTLNACGIDVINLGLSTTPTVEIAVPNENAGGGIILTASHNPKQWNALKLLNHKGEFLSSEDGQKVLDFAANQDFEYEEIEKIGSTTNREDYFDIHIKQILDLALVDVDAIKAKNFKVVLDSVNSTGAIAVPKLLNALGVTQIVSLFDSVDGKFAHNPEPLPENLTELATQVKVHKADIGIAVDPDVDRLALVCEDGSFFGEEYTLVAVADYVLTHKKGATVSNLSSSRALQDVAEKHGCIHHASAVGEVNVVTKMKESGAAIGGEGNGGIIYPDLHFGRDSLVGIALFLTHLAHQNKKVSEVRAMYPNYHISKNKIELEVGMDVDGILEKVIGKYSSNKINTVDGVRIDFEKEWVHLRKSNTEPIIRIYSESKDQTTAENLAEKLMSDIRSFA